MWVIHPKYIQGKRLIPTLLLNLISIINPILYGYSPYRKNPWLYTSLEWCGCIAHPDGYRGVSCSRTQRETPRQRGTYMEPTETRVVRPTQQPVLLGDWRASGACGGWAMSLREAQERHPIRRLRLTRPYLKQNCQKRRVPGFACLFFISSTIS